MTELQTFVQGRLVPASEATVSAYDRGFRSGDGVFETLRAYDDHLFRLHAHVQRAVNGAQELGFALRAERLVDALVGTVQANRRYFGGEDSVVRLTASSGSIDPDTAFPGTAVGQPTLVVSSHHLALAPATQGKGVSARTETIARELPHIKAVSYLVASTATRRARAAGADEALLLGPTDRLLEGAASNVFAVIGGRLVTPPSTDGLLEGVTRGVVLDLAASCELVIELRSVTRAELLAADEAFLTSSIREVVPLVRVDGEPIADGLPGPLTRSLQAAYRAEVRNERRSRLGRRSDPAR